MAAIRTHATTTQLTHGLRSSTVSTTPYRLVATTTTALAHNHAHQREDDRASVVAGLSETSLSEHDVRTRRHNNDNTNNVTTLLLPVPACGISSSSRRRCDVAEIELQEISQLDSGMTFTVDDDDIRFADDVNDDDDDVTVFRSGQATERDTNLRHHHHHHHQQQQQHIERLGSSRDDACRVSLLSSVASSEEFGVYRHDQRIDTVAGVPTRPRRFCSHRRLSSRRRQRRSKTAAADASAAGAEWQTSSQVIGKLSASLRHFTHSLPSLVCRRQVTHHASLY